ncbi:hypothetical protein KSS92_07955 [Pseudomonas atacamensis]|uniref:hypothetical protein n=1 Tax=Pseudomonas atacamensis TaxID=2565368 RepID=UPI001C3CDFDC|nr:hypothetical protein [Pseudomonas atacamensis]QXH74426.1 hypothetical protein KSS92_07955 [Pseudomonas atacamensis]
MNKKLILAILLSTVSGLAAAENAKSILVPGSQDRDFGVVCRINGNDTFSVKESNRNNGYKVARNIYLTDISAGRVAISMMRGFVSANEYTTYVTATGESCETFSK